MSTVADDGATVTCAEGDGGRASTAAGGAAVAGATAGGGAGASTAAGGAAKKGATADGGAVVGTAAGGASEAGTTAGGAAVAGTTTGGEAAVSFAADPTAGAGAVLPAGVSTARTGASSPPPETTTGDAGVGEGSGGSGLPATRGRSRCAAAAGRVTPSPDVLAACTTIRGGVPDGFGGLALTATGSGRASIVLLTSSSAVRRPTTRPPSPPLPSFPPSWPGRTGAAVTVLATGAGAAAVTSDAAVPSPICGTPAPARVSPRAPAVPE